MRFAEGIEHGSGRVRAEAGGAALMRVGLDAEGFGEDERVAGGAHHSGGALNQLLMGDAVVGLPLHLYAAVAREHDAVFRVGQVFRHDPPVDAAPRHRAEQGLGQVRLGGREHARL